MTYRALAWTTPILLSVGLAACVPDFPVATAKLAAPTPIRVDYSHQDLALTVPASASDLPMPLVTQIDSFVAQNAPSEGLHAIIHLPASDSRVYPAIVRELRRQGVMLVSARTVQGQVSIELGRYTVAIPPCEATIYKSDAADGQLATRQFGCATQSDLAAMVADPADLVAGSTHGPFDAMPAAAAVSRYQNDRTTPLLTTPDLPIRSVPGKSPGGDAPAGVPTSGGGAGGSGT